MLREGDAVAGQGRVGERVLLSGIPGSGKSSYGQALATHAGFVHLDLEKPGVLKSYGLEGAWGSVFSTGSAAELATALDALRAPVALDWGFPVRWLSAVASLANAGITPWWFDGDRSAARTAYVAREANNGDAWDAQVRSIDQSWRQIERVMGAHAVQAIAPGPVFTPHRAIARQMFGDAVPWVGENGH